MVVAPVGTGGAVNLYNSAGSADVIVDVVGYFTTTGGSGYRSVTPTRVLDGWSTPMKAGQARVLAVAQRLGVPAGQLTGVAVNVTIAGAPAPGYVQLSPGSGTTTATSTANVSVGQDVANRAFVGVQNGQLTVRLAGTSAPVFVDIVGYFTSDGTGARYTSVTPDPGAGHPQRHRRDGATRRRPDGQRVGHRSRCAQRRQQRAGHPDQRPNHDEELSGCLWRRQSAAQDQ